MQVYALNLLTFIAVPSFLKYARCENYDDYNIWGFILDTIQHVSLLCSVSDNKSFLSLPPESIQLNRR